MVVQLGLCLPAKDLGLFRTVQGVSCLPVCLLIATLSQSGALSVLGELTFLNWLEENVFSPQMDILILAGVY